MTRHTVRDMHGTTLFASSLAVTLLGACMLAHGAAPRGACNLLTDAEIKAAFPGAGAGVPETAREKYGILGCEWSTPKGRVAAQFWQNESKTTARAEAEGLMLGVVDPLKAGAQKAVRYQDLPGIGESAVLSIAKRDAATGVLSDLAIVVVVAGGRTITIFAPQLASDPAKATATLTGLARNAARR